MKNSQTPPLPNKKYNIIYADPPWKVKASYITGASGVKSHVSDHYDLMPLSEICALPVAEIAAENCLLFLWITSPELFDAKKVGTAWGFKYITVAFVWDKQRPLKGHYTMSQCELCLVFKKGKIPQPRGARNVRQLLRLPADESEYLTDEEIIELTFPEFISIMRGRHSEKPKEVGDRIVEMFPTQTKIELFARERVEGWDAWGNEVYM